MSRSPSVTWEYASAAISLRTGHQIEFLLQYPCTARKDESDGACITVIFGQGDKVRPAAAPSRVFGRGARTPTSLFHRVAGVRLQ